MPNYRTSSYKSFGYAIALIATLAMHLFSCSYSDSSHLSGSDAASSGVSGTVLSGSADTSSSSAVEEHSLDDISGAALINDRLTSGSCYVFSSGDPDPVEEPLRSMVRMVRDNEARDYGQRCIPEEVQVVISVCGDEIFAIAVPVADHFDGERNFHVFEVGIGEGDAELKLKFVSSLIAPLSPGIAMSIVERNGKYLICGGVSDSHWLPEDGTVMDLSGRNYLVIESRTVSLRLPVNSSDPWCGYVALLDAPLTEVSIYDASDKLLFRFSKHSDEVLVKYN